MAGNVTVAAGAGELISFDGRPIEAVPGMTVAAALTAAGIRVVGTTRSGAPRGPFCGMGVCHGCLVEIDGRPDRRACLARVAGPHELRSQHGERDLAAGVAEPRSAHPPEKVEVLVVGGGAGGLMAAAVAAEAGAEVVLVDERPAPGGQHYLQPVGAAPADDARYAIGRALLARVHRAGVRRVQGAACHAALPLRVAVDGDDGARTFRPRRLVVATGAFERPLPVPGWTLPGVTTIGAVQVLLRGYGVPAGRRVLVAGNGPHGLQVAGELRRAGAEIVAVAEAALRPGILGLRDVLAMTAADPALTSQGRALLRELRAIAADGAGLVASLSDGSEHRADLVAMGYGFLPANELLRLLGCRHRFDRGRGHLVTVRDESCRTSVENVLAVGDCCGLGGAKVAEMEGAVAGAVAAGRAPNPRAVVRLGRQRAFQAAMWRLFAAPYRGLGLADAATAVCRCEEVTLAEVEAAIAAGAASPTALAQVTRAGLGRCRGRYCGPWLADLLHARLGLALDEHALLAPRPPGTEAAG
jgi:NADPH-dependent 2,4-dienoyl-CoA reductase/sulfur reductase-like enzyme